MGSIADPESPVVVDVFICGAGPVGLLAGYTLARMDVKTFIVERFTKDVQSSYGRACTLYPRTMEMLDQLDLLDEMNQIGFIGRNSVTYKDGKRVTSRGWHSQFSQMGESYLDYLLNIRQKYSESVFLERYRKFGGDVHFQWELKDFSVNENASDGLKITATVRDVNSGISKIIKSKYILGADGGSSLVRQLAAIPFKGDTSTFNWVRIDAVVKTNMPDASLGFGAIESPTHGNVLWVSLDHGRNRIGFALTEEMYAKYGNNMTEEQVKEEAVKSLAPFSLEFVEVDWFTIYSIKQRVADHFFSQGCIFLAGDACHTHSSGAAQGMNTGVHDAVNLGWKLGGVLRGWYDPAILKTYEAERRPAALNLIRLDKLFSALISGAIPEEYSKLGGSLDPNELLLKAYEESMQFNLGLGIHYDCNLLNKTPNTGVVSPGWRGPDALLYPPGSHFPIRLFQLTKNTGTFSVLIFAGEPLLTNPSISKARNYLDSDASFTKKVVQQTVRFLTIIAGTSSSAELVLGGSSFGYTYYDRDHSAHVKYGVSIESGAIVVLRPDGIFGFATTLDKMEEVEEYFMSFAVEP